MTATCRLLAVVPGAAIALMVAAAPAVAAPAPGASCVGTIAGTLAPQGQLDIDQFKALAAAGGSPSFGQFVAGGAQLHAGSLGACLPG